MPFVMDAILKNEVVDGYDGGKNLIGMQNHCRGGGVPDRANRLRFC